MCLGLLDINVRLTPNEHRKRMTVHRQQIRVGLPETRQLWVNEHIDSCSKQVPQFFVCPLKKK